ncbi:MAG: Arc family DNA-binding protein [Devosia sp.]
MPRGDFPSTKQDQYMVRFPDGMRDELKARAGENNRSMNQEIVSRLERTFAIDRANFEAAERVARGEQPEQIPMPQGVEDYGVNKAVPVGERRLPLDVANEAISDAIARSVRAAVDDAMTTYLGNASVGQSGFRAWFEEATASLTPDGPEAQQLLDELRARVSAMGDNQDKARSAEPAGGESLAARGRKPRRISSGQLAVPKGRK